MRADLLSVEGLSTKPLFTERKTKTGEEEKYSEGLNLALLEEAGVPICIFIISASDKKS